jgi:hypothetical protein
MLALALLVTGCVGNVDDVPAGGADATTTASSDAARSTAPDSAPAAADAGVDVPDGAPGVDVLASESGCFFTAATGQPNWTAQVGASGAQYRWITIDYDVIHGGWRQELFDRPVLNHNLMGLTRRDPEFVGRYILGNAAQIRPQENGLARKSLFYGRVDLEPRPAGQGYTGYTSWRSNFSWQVGETYHVRVRIDAITKTQRLVVTHVGGTESATTVGEIAYWEPRLSASTFDLELGGTESDGREVRAVGWQFCDLRVEARPL